MYEIGMTPIGHSFIHSFRKICLLEMKQKHERGRHKIETHVRFEMTDFNIFWEGKGLKMVSFLTKVLMWI